MRAATVSPSEALVATSMAWSDGGHFADQHQTTAIAATSSRERLPDALLQRPASASSSTVHHAVANVDGDARRHAAPSVFQTVAHYVPGRPQRTAHEILQAIPEWVAQTALDAAYRSRSAICDLVDSVIDDVARDLDATTASPSASTHNATVAAAQRPLTATLVDVRHQLANGILRRLRQTCPAMPPRKVHRSVSPPKASSDSSSSPAVSINMRRGTSPPPRPSSSSDAPRRPHHSNLLASHPTHSSPTVGWGTERWPSSSPKQLLLVEGRCPFDPRRNEDHTTSGEEKSITVRARDAPGRKKRADDGIPRPQRAPSSDVRVRVSTTRPTPIGPCCSPMCSPLVVTGLEVDRRAVGHGLQAVVRDINDLLATVDRQRRGRADTLRRQFQSAGSSGGQDVVVKSHRALRQALQDTRDADNVSWRAARRRLLSMSGR